MIIDNFHSLPLILGLRPEKLKPHWNLVLLDPETTLDAASAPYGAQDAASDPRHLPSALQMPAIAFIEPFGFSPRYRKMTCPFFSSAAAFWYLGHKFSFPCASEAPIGDRWRSTIGRRFFSSHAHPMALELTESFAAKVTVCARTALPGDRPVGQVDSRLDQDLEAIADFPMMRFPSATIYRERCGA